MPKHPKPLRAHRLAAGTLAVALAGSAAAAPAPTGDQAWYYDIGGAEPISVPMNADTESITLGAEGELGLGYSCGAFDATATVKNLFDDVGSSVQNILVGTARGALSSLPLYILERALPGLYELLQSYMTDFKHTFELSEKSCQDFEREILTDNDPYAAWVAAAKGESWKREMASGNDAVAAKTAVAEGGGDSGVTWIGGDKAAGVGQPPIETLRDVTQTGWNMALNRAPDDTDTYTPGETPPRLVELFPAREDAGDYTVRVLGDEVVRTCDGCGRQSIGGHGLLPEYERERERLVEHLTALLADTGVPTHEELEALAAPGVGITARVIQTLRQLPDDEGGIMAGRLVAEVAAARTAEKALAIRRLILTARRAPAVQSNGQAQRTLDRALTELEREVDNILYEVRVRRDLASNTAGALIARDNEMRGEGSGTAEVPEPPPSRFLEGGGFAQ